MLSYYADLSQCDLTAENRDGLSLVILTYVMRISDLDKAIDWNCFSLTIGESYGIDFVA